MRNCFFTIDFDDNDVRYKVPEVVRVFRENGSACAKTKSHTKRGITCNLGNA
jgi:hypothetical protein